MLQLPAQVNGYFVSSSFSTSQKFASVQKDLTSEAASFNIGKKVAEKLPFCKPAFHHSFSLQQWLNGTFCPL
jgi:hypothetical protein